jgi:hypothetical protein
MRELTHPLVDLGSRWAECVRTPQGWTIWPPDGLIIEIINDPGAMSEYARGMAAILASYAADGSALVSVDTIVGDNPGLRGQINGALRELADYGYIELIGGVE